MGTIFSRKITPESKVEVADLKEIKLLNTISESGKVNGLESPFLDKLTDSYENWVDQYDGKKEVKNKNSVKLFNLIKTYSKWFRSRFEYENLPEELNRELVESLLFRYGSIAMFKLDNEFVLTPYKVEKTDIYNRPTKITPLPINGSLSFKSREVNKNCIILRASGSVVFFDSQPMNSPLFLNFYSLIDIVNQYGELVNDSILTRQRLGIGDDTDDATALNLEKAIMSGKPILKFDNNGLNSILQGKTMGSSGLIDFESRHESINANLKSMIDYFKLNNGWTYDENADKKERKIKDEMRTNSQTANNYMDSDLETRENDWEIANKVFNLNVLVEIKEDKNDTISQGEVEEESQGEDNE